MRDFITKLCSTNKSFQRYNNDDFLFQTFITYNKLLKIKSFYKKKTTNYFIFFHLLF